MNNESRYHRQSLIPDWDQQKLKNAKVIILGIGALGSYVATNLTLAGVGSLILVDFDTIETSNLNRQLLFVNDDVGKNKAEIAAQKLKKLNEDIDIIPFGKSMEELPNSLISGTSLLLSCLDTFPGRRWANSLAIREKVPMITGGMYAFIGQIQTIIPYKTPCFECQPLIPEEKLAQACSPLGEKRKELREEKEEPSLPAVSTVSSIIGGLMSQECLKLLLEIGVPLNNYMVYDGLNNNYTTIELSKNKNCPICGDNYKLKSAILLIFKDDNLTSVKNRIAYAFGLADPKLMIKGKFLSDDHKINWDNKTIIFVLDDRLALPLSLKVKFEKISKG
ncbi:MAG: Molybdopterin-synthase adenylyltransferase [Candidatus Heimdallarchaeota archaeon LC_2]|nr:MAG: Molybdopterin-synthase adenylyltransferase [Candidatus Heimdallarchaeota archaeon LC_2]